MYITLNDVKSWMPHPLTFIGNVLMTSYEDGEALKVNVFC